MKIITNEMLKKFKAHLTEEEKSNATIEIIYRIPQISFILGFDDVVTERCHNFCMLDALPYAKDGTRSMKNAPKRK